MTKLCVLGQDIHDFPLDSCLYKDFKGRQFSSVLYQYYLGMQDSPLFEQVFDTFPIKKEDIFNNGFLQYVLNSMADYRFESNEFYPPFESNLCREIFLYTESLLKEKHVKDIQFLLSSQTLQSKINFFNHFPEIVFNLIKTQNADLIELLLEEGAPLEYFDKHNNYHHIFSSAIYSSDLQLVKVVSHFLDLESCQQQLDILLNTQFSPLKNKLFIENCILYLNSLCLTKKIENELSLKPISKITKNKI